MKVTKFLFIFIFIVKIAFPQSNTIFSDIDNLKKKAQPPILTKEQMYADFDSLISIMNEYNAQIPLRNKATGTDMLYTMKKLRKEVEYIKTSQELSFLFYRVLGLATDKHCSISDELYYFKYSYAKKARKKLNITEKDDAINQHYIDYVRSQFYVLSAVFYLDGKYFTQTPMILSTADTTVQIDAGAELCVINTTAIDQYISARKSIQKDIRWDFEHKKYYVFGNLYAPTSDTLKSITFKVNGKQVSFDNIKSRQLVFYRNKDRVEAPVHYFEEDSILYIRLPSMSVHYAKRIKKQIKKCKPTNLKSIVIDVRGNTGGNDKTWVKLLSYLVKKPFVSNLKLAINSSDIVKSTMPKNIQKKTKPIFIECLDNMEYYLVLDEKQEQSPQFKSLDFDGEIILMVDENIYSSTGCFASLAYDNENITTIGVKSNFILGRGLLADFFILPNSRLYFSLDKFIDVSNINSVEDIYNIKVQEEINLPLSYYILRANTFSGKYSKDFLENQDVFFKKVIEYIKHNEK